MHTDAPLRVALLSPCFWPEVRRGSERIIHELGTGLAARGDQVRLITSHPGRPSRDVEDGIEVVRNWRPPDGWLRRRGFEDYPTHVPLSYRTLVEGNDDLAHAFHVTDALAARRWARKTGKPFLLTYVGIPDRIGLLDRRRRLAVTQRALDGCAAVTVVSEAAARAFERWLGVEATVVYPGIDLTTFAPAAERDPVPTIICAAAIEEPRKRVDLLVRAFEVVRRERPDARLVLNRPRSEGAHGVEAVDGIELVDLDGRATLASAYGRAWVSALPAIGEAFGLVLAEALACGTPVVGSKHGGIPEVVSGPEVGRLFNDEDGPGGLARALLEALLLAEDPGTQDACVRRAAEFEVSRSVERYAALYESALNGTR